MFVHTERIKQRLAQLCGPDFLNVCTVVPDPVPPLEHPLQREARLRLGLPSEGPIVLFFGGVVAMPIYWYLYIWREGPRPASPTERLP